MSNNWEHWEPGNISRDSGPSESASYDAMCHRTRSRWHDASTALLVFWSDDLSGIAEYHGAPPGYA